MIYHQPQYLLPTVQQRIKLSLVLAQGLLQLYRIHITHRRKLPSSVQCRPHAHAAASERRNRGSISFSAPGISSSVRIPVSFPAPGTAAPVNYMHTPTIIQHMVISGNEDPGPSTAPTNFAFANSPGGIPDNF